MTTDEMLAEIVKYKYKASGFPFVFLDYDCTLKFWAVTWRNPAEFYNEKQTEASTPHEACKKALEFIKNNPQFFKKK